MVVGRINMVVVLVVVLTWWSYLGVGDINDGR